MSDSTTEANIRRAGRRTALFLLILGGAFLALTAFWVIKEAKRIRSDRDKRLAQNAEGSEMERLPGGPFTMGANDGEEDEKPLHDVKLSAFWMDRTEVTNGQFARFVSATKYVTSAEREGGSWCISADGKDGQVLVKGASWKTPGGPGSNIDGRENYPVVHVSHDDATAYAKWAGKRLPTEAEWEGAARGGVLLSKYPWGIEPSPGGRYPANTWQGDFPKHDEALDGFAGLAPVGSYAPNNYALADLAGNVAEWCADWYSADYYAQLRPIPDRAAHKNPTGPETSLDPAEIGVSKRVVRGGSWISGPQGFRVATRGKYEPTFSAQWLGFRCVKNAE